MFKKALIASAFSMFIAAPAFAGSCPVMVGEIDAALAAGSSASAEDQAEAKRLRDEGEALHQSGDHGESVKVLQQAKALLEKIFGVKAADDVSFRAHFLRAGMNDKDDEPAPDPAAPGTHWNPKITPQRHVLDGEGMTKEQRRAARRQPLER